MSEQVYLSDVLLLCSKCGQAIKARITTPQWIKVEWISPDGECQTCNQSRKEIQNGTAGNKSQFPASVPDLH